MKNKVTRRSFIQKTGLGIAGLSVATSFPAKAMNFLSPSVAKSKVVYIKNPKVIDVDGKIDTDILYKMLEQGMCEFAGTNDIAAVWKQFFTPEDIIGLKLNVNMFTVFEGTEMLHLYPRITDTIIKSMTNAGIMEENLILWDRSDQELSDVGYTVQKEKGALRIMGQKAMRRDQDGDYTDEEFAVGEKTTRVSNILARECTKIINIPVLKSHGRSGVTGALKNHYGSISNPNQFHDNLCCYPGIAELNALPPIRDKHALVIGSGLMNVFEGGPRWNRQFMWSDGSLFIGTDPVAVDRVMLKVLDEKRELENLPPVEEKAIHLQLSEEMGLGNSQLENIELKELLV